MQMILREKVNMKIILARSAFLGEWKRLSEGKKRKEKSFSDSSFGSGEVALGQGNTSKKSANSQVNESS